MKQVRYRKPRKSMFDPYYAMIKSGVESGLTLQQISELLEPYFEEVNLDSLYMFLRRKKLQLIRGKYNRNRLACKNCDQCIDYENVRGNKAKLCMADKKEIPIRCITAPAFCRKKAERAS